MTSELFNKRRLTIEIDKLAARGLEEGGTANHPIFFENLEFHVIYWLLSLTVEYAAEALSHDMISRIRVANCRACAK